MVSLVASEVNDLYMTGEKCAYDYYYYCLRCRRRHSGGDIIFFLSVRER